ncbi:MAG: bifunctional homocysteine S-methyltransferase/methylenetetrahydrofolate reductase [Spirochaetales bacterium]|nr:bifunctional homocysteine S-methyltransferase/methylenetetrahydrofolate reductase [Spirochaetales bacterium]
MLKKELRDRLEHSVLMADGGMGTMIQNLAATPVKCVEALNLSHPEIVREIHTQFIQAGAELIETNTFGANRLMLQKYELNKKVKEINAQGVRCAKQAIRPGCYIAGSIGPFIPPTEEISDDDREYYREIIIEQATVLLEEGVDIIICETFANIRHLCFTANTIKEISGIPVITSMTIGPSFVTYDSLDVFTAVEKLTACNTDSIGFNCGHGIQIIETALERLGAIDLPLTVMPNAGLPERIGGRIIFGISEEYFAEKALSFARLGARIIGGCCGITPSDIAAASARLQKEKIVRKQRKRKHLEAVKESIPFKKGAFLKKIDPIRLPVICEIDPPAKLDLTRNLEAIVAVKEAGAHAVSMADNPLAKVKVSNLAFAALAKQKTEISIILHLTGRDRNLIGLQSYMLGAHVLGIEGLLLITGDPSHDQTGPSNVFDVDAIGLVKAGVGINNGKNLLGKDIGEETNLSLGVAVNPNMKDYSVQVKRLKRKVDAGAQFVMTQPLFEPAKIREFCDKTGELGIKRFIGIFPIIAARTAEYLHNEVPGIVIPETLRDALAKKEHDKEYQVKTGIEFTINLIRQTAGIIDGLYLIAPHTRPELLAELVKFSLEL